jgi:hypothetical protein
MPQETEILLLRSGRVGKRCESLLRECGIPVAVADPEEPLPVIGGYAAVGLAADRPCPAAEARLDAFCWEAGVPWSSCILLAHEFRIGPAIARDRTPCFGCWTLRRRSQAALPAVEDALAELGARSNGPWFEGALAPLDEQVAAMGVAEFVSLALNAYTYAPHHLGRFWAGNAVRGSLEEHFYARLSGCTRCGPGEAGENSWSRLAAHFERRLQE